MPVETPVIKPPFSKEQMGIDFNLFLQHLYGLPGFSPLSRKETATFTGFSDERSGERTLARWHEIGLLNLTDCDMFDRPAIAVVKLTQVCLVQKTIILGEVSKLLAYGLAGSELEIFVGQLRPESVLLKGRIKLLLPDDPWHTDSLTLRAHTNGDKTRASDL